MNNYQDYMPSLNPLQDTIRKLTDFTLPNRDLRDFRDRARREASTGVATQRAALQGTRQTLEQQRTQALNALQRNRALLPNWFQQSLQQMSQQAQQQEAQRGVASSGLGLRNVLQAGQAPLQQHVQGLQNLIGQQGQVEGDFLNQLMSQVFRPERELALQEGSDAAQRYMTYVNEAQQSLFEGRLQEAERLLNQAQLEYDALVKEAENRIAIRAEVKWMTGCVKRSELLVFQSLGYRIYVRLLCTSRLETRMRLMIGTLMRNEVHLLKGLCRRLNRRLTNIKCLE